MDENKTKRITDKEVYDAIDAVKADKSGSIATALVALLAISVDTRAFIRKLYKETVPARIKNEKK